MQVVLSFLLARNVQSSRRNSEFPYQQYLALLETGKPAGCDESWSHSRQGKSTLYLPVVEKCMCIFLLLSQNICRSAVADYHRRKLFFCRESSFFMGISCFSLAFSNLSKTRHAPFKNVCQKTFTSVDGVPKKKRQPWMAYPTSSECAAAPTIRLDLGCLSQNLRLEGGGIFFRLPA